MLIGAARRIRPSPNIGAIRGPIGEAPPTRGVRRPGSSTAALHRFWERFSDDRDLFRLKIILLAGLVALVAILERAV